MRVYIDLETEPITDDCRLPRPVVVGAAREDLPDVSVVTGTRDLIAFCEQELAEGSTLYAHNGAHFDFPVLAYWSEACDLGGVALWADAAHRDRLVCTSIAAQLADIAKGPSKRDWYPLDRVCRDYGVTIPLDKANPWRLRYQELEHVPLAWWPAEAREYLFSDVRALQMVAPRIGLPADTHRKTEQHFWLELSSFKGARTDVSAAQIWGALLRAKLAELAEPLRKAHLIDAEGKKSAKAMRVAICGVDTSELSPEEIDIIDKEIAENPPAGVARTAPTKRNPKGQIKTDAIACEDSESPLMALVTQYNKTQSTLAREWPIVMRGRVHTRYGMADSGRTTSSDPAMQNLGTASGARACFIADEDMHLAIADWTMLELCCLGQICVELGAGGTLAKALREGRDVHAELARSLAQAGGFGDDPKRLRRLAKEANFGRGGGMGANTLRATARKRGLIFDLPTAQSLIKVHANQWPEIPRYHGMVNDHIEGSGGVVTHYRSMRVRGGLVFTNATNTLFQGLGADVALSGFVACARAGYLPQLFVHDEYHWSLREPGETESIRDILRRVSKDWLSHCPSKIEPVIVPDWSAKS
jgi:LmbE family N-acetylglucosaminyl deacetylase